MRPPAPKYSMTWDPQIVLDYISKGESNQKLSLSSLSHKLVALLLLSSGQRIQTLSNIKLNEISCSGELTVVNIENRLKTSRPGQCTTIRLKIFPDSALCVVTCLKCYIERTNAIRKSEYLFIQCKSPYQKACSQTISNWAKRVLMLAGVNTSIFSAHSYRHASTSKAAQLGVSLHTIFNAAGWSERSRVFQKFYNRPVCLNNGFAEAILANKFT